MKKLVLYAMTAAIAMTGAAPLSAQAAMKVYAVPGSSMGTLSGVGCEKKELCLPSFSVIGNWCANEEHVNRPEESLPPQEENDIRSFARQVIDLVNEERAKAGLSPLKEENGIAQAAAVRAQEISRIFSHTRPDGSSYSTALQQSGVTFRGAGENIAYGQKTPEEVMRSWMNSQGHRANILNPDYTSIGVGYYQDSQGVGYWTQLFTY